jgi:hypothetical protein
MKLSDSSSHATNIGIFEHSFSAQVSGTRVEQGNVRINVIVMHFRETIFVDGKQLVVHVLSVCL